jgi:hypothetical protein
VFVLVLAVGLAVQAADTIPSRYTDAEFWRLINDLSEPDAPYPYENFVSNEISYQRVLPELTGKTKPGGVYLGVAVEQNFTYVAALKPQVAFIIDIRRQNLIEMLMYKALFDVSADRADFVSRLFSRKRPAGLGVTSSAQEIFQAFDSVVPDATLHRETLQAIKDNLVKQHQFKLSADDLQKVDYIFNVFFRGGPRMDYAYASATPVAGTPSYVSLMVANDGRGENWAYLQTEDRYRFIRDMQQRNLIVPIVGDFAGPKAVQEVGKYLRNHGATVSVFYISNVEDYLEQSWSRYQANIVSLPKDDSSTFIHFWPCCTTRLRPMSDVPQTWPGRN